MQVSKLNLPFEFYCHIPQAVHELKNGVLPVARRRLTKKEAVQIMNLTGVLCHVGAGNGGTIPNHSHFYFSDVQQTLQRFGRE